MEDTVLTNVGIFDLDCNFISAWLFNDRNVTQLYRKYVQGHYELVPYLYSSGINAYSTQESLLTPTTYVFHIIL